ncbi:DUF115 domain-containing protein [Anaerocolumna sedimenticola]|uniref:DUF115 domain-containing protein n=1 Tax=Anaerocolumna sedimenticola TaxID=2696063 RepID=A0A6P1TKR8_9FIRM|nr:6-hydroxymethylpterin diphosphokinase MptE-like protein [Anaerocolumna sedimenticola]QHQ60702.1 DUF115 domain-containing protein [Anaerocolumna sedimenticola]
MEYKVKNVYDQNIQLLNNINKLIYHFHSQNYDYALRLTSDIINLFTQHLKVLKEYQSYFNQEILIYDMQSTMEIFEGILNAQENKDYILLADLYELQIIPLLTKLQEILISKEGFSLLEGNYQAMLEIIEKNYSNITTELKKMPEPSTYDNRYQIEFTSVGLMTLAIIDENSNKYYFHSNNNPSSEAMTLAHSWYKEDKTEYVIYGLGLGYHIFELFNLDRSITIEIYESDLRIIQLMCAYSNIAGVFKFNNIKLVYDPEFKQLIDKLSNLTEDSEFVIHYPSLRSIQNTVIREKLDNYFIQYSSIKNQSHLLNSNYRSNVNNYDGFVDDLKEKFKGKDLFIIAAGPSLDKNYLELKKVSGRGVILATGTVLKKLINAGIKPDYFIVTDANERVYAQISGLENMEIPMIFLSTAYKGFAAKYKGKRYMVCQEGYPKAEEFAAANNISLYQTGGSVSTTALDVGINLGCKRIIFLGLDLAYTNNFVHASNTSRRNLASTEGLRQVEDIEGNLIYTSRSLDMYREWIEKRIAGVKGVEFIDATEGGARIRGMNILKLSTLLSGDKL